MSLSGRKLLRVLKEDARPRLVAEETESTRRILLAAKGDVKAVVSDCKTIIISLTENIREYKAAIKAIDKDLDKIPEDEWGETIVGDIEDYRDEIDAYVDAFERALAQLKNV